MGLGITSRRKCLRDGIRVYYDDFYNRERYCDMRLRTFSEIQRYILLQGKLKQKEKHKWVFTAHPDSNCPIREAEGRSRWTLIEELYNTLRVMEAEVQHEKNLEKLCY